jgi:hypothetical protein
MMRRALVLLLLLAVSAACRNEPAAMEPLDSWEAAEIQARAFNFQVHPGAQYVDSQTELLRRAHFAMQPSAKTPPPMAVYTTPAPLDEVVDWYSERYGAQPEATAGEGAKPAAWLVEGDLAEDASAIAPLLRQLGVESDLAAAQGRFRGANFMQTEDHPRATLQRPWFDVENGRVVDETMILLVDESGLR